MNAIERLFVRVFGATRGTSLYSRLINALRGSYRVSIMEMAFFALIGSLVTLVVQSYVNPRVESVPYPMSFKVAGLDHHVVIYNDGRTLLSTPTGYMKFDQPAPCQFVVAVDAITGSPTVVADASRDSVYGDPSMVHHLVGKCRK